MTIQPKIFSHNSTSSIFNLKYVKISFLVLLFLIKARGEALASKEFEIETFADYSIDENGLTHVEHDITFTNKNASTYATHYALSVVSTQIDNIWAKDETGSLSPKVDVTSNSTTLSIEFKQKVVGIGQKLKFTIGYDDKDVNQVIGKIWETNISMPDNLEDYENYEISLTVPTIYDKPLQIVPEPTETKYLFDKTTYHFDKQSLEKKGITSLFGDVQVFSFDLRYSLDNPYPFKKTIEIALPPDTQFQKVYYNAISPKPVNIKIDEDGNWLAEYKLSPRENLEVHALGYVIIKLDNISNEYLEDEMIKKYLSKQPPWQTEDDEIKNLALNLKTPENIYNFVIDTLNYDSDGSKKDFSRLGAKGALSYPDKSTCMEFTDLFIALSRAAGIPSRELNGFAYTQNPNLRPLSLRQDILHSWPEYYDFDQHKWVQIDPTWEDTTQGTDYFSRFDLNHFVFVIHGKNSLHPFPAGFYKSEGRSGKDIKITPHTQDPASKTHIQISLDLPDEILSGIDNSGNIIVDNFSNYALQDELLKVYTQEIDLLTTNEYIIEKIPPYASVKLPISLKTRNIYDSGSVVVQLQIADQEYEKKFKITPIYKKITFYFISLTLGALFIIIASISRGLFFSFFKK